MALKICRKEDCHLRGGRGRGGHCSDVGHFLEIHPRGVPKPWPEQSPGRETGECVLGWKVTQCHYEVNCGALGGNMGSRLNRWA